MLGPYYYLLSLSLCTVFTWFRNSLHPSIAGSDTTRKGERRAPLRAADQDTYSRKKPFITVSLGDSNSTMTASVNNDSTVMGLGNSTTNLTETWKPPLSTRGRYIIDANNRRFKLRGGNWHGASGTYLGRGDINDDQNHHVGEKAYQTPLCLDRVAIDDIVDSFLRLGINSVRLPFSNEMIHTTAQNTIPDSALAANPQLKGMTPLEIYDACIEALTKKGIAVILNNHTVKSLWCCGVDVNARWNGIQSTETWIQDWLFMARRYKDNARVVGAELYKWVTSAPCSLGKEKANKAPSQRAKERLSL